MWASAVGRSPRVKELSNLSRAGNTFETAIVF